MSEVYVVLGATGQVGSATASALLAQGKAVRVVVRDEQKGEAWQAQGATVSVVEDVTDADGLARAFDGAAGAFVLNPPDYKSDDMFARAERVGHALAQAAQAASLPRMAFLSSVGAHIAQGTGNIRTAHLVENILRPLPLSVSFMRAASFLDNWKSLVPVAQQNGVLPSFYVPLDRALPMVSSTDIGQACADVLTGRIATPSPSGIFDLHGPQDYSPNDIATAFSSVLEKPVQAVPIPQAEWAGIIAHMGNSPSAAQSYTEMMNAINDGTIVFEDGSAATQIKGVTTAAQAIAQWAK